VSQSSNAIQAQEITALSIQRKPGCRIELEVKASPNLVATARKNAIRKVGKDVTFPGFRKGHAPENIILKQYPVACEENWRETIANLVFATAQMQISVPILNSGSPITFDLKNYSLDEGALIVFSFETEPEIPSVDPSLFQRRTIDSVEVTDEKVDEAIYQMRFYHAKWEAIHDRAIQEGDFIVIDVETLGSHPDEPSEKVFDHIRFEVSEKRMANWMKNLVSGAKTGDILEGISTPDDSEDEDLDKSLTDKKVRITIHHVERAILPVVDDEFAQKIGSPDVIAMRDFVRTFLQQTAANSLNEALREQVNDFLSEQYPFDLPLSLIEVEKKHRLKTLDENKSADSSTKQMSTEQKKFLEEKIYTESAQALRLFYLSRQVVRQAEIAITEQEVQQYAVQSAARAHRKIDPENLSKETFASALYALILLKAQNIF